MISQVYLNVHRTIWPHSFPLVSQEDCLVYEDPNLTEGERYEHQGRGLAAVQVQVLQPLLSLGLRQSDGHRCCVVSFVRGPGPSVTPLMVHCDIEMM